MVPSRAFYQNPQGAYQSANLRIKLGVQREGLGRLRYPKGLSTGDSFGCQFRGLRVAELRSIGIGPYGARLKVCRVGQRVTGSGVWGLCFYGEGFRVCAAPDPVLNSQGLAEDHPQLKFINGEGVWDLGCRV